MSDYIEDAVANTLEHVRQNRSSMESDEWLAYLEGLRTAINTLIEAASTGGSDV